MQGFFLGWWKYPDIGGSDGCTILNMPESIEWHNLKIVNFMVCELFCQRLLLLDIEGPWN